MRATKKSTPKLLLLVAAVFIVVVAGCGSDDAAEEEGAEVTSPSDSPAESAQPAVTQPLPPDVPVPPTDFYDPPLDLDGLIGRPADEAVAWGEAQGFEIVVVVPPDGDVDAAMLPQRLIIRVDERNVVVRAQQG